MAEGPGDDCQLLAVLEHEGRVGMAQIVEPLSGRPARGDMEDTNDV